MARVKLRLVENPDDLALPSGLQVGDMFRYTKRDMPARDCYGIVLPDDTVFYTTDHAEETGMWEQTGDPPDITLSPSILRYPSSHSAGWHGFVRDGFLVDV